MPVTTGAAGKPLEVWGCARPAADVFQSTGAVQKVEIQFAPPGGFFRTLRSVVLDAHDGCYLDTKVAFPGAGSVRLAWRSPDGWQYSRIQALVAS
jgi:hypothetical protein